jgi:hypothetical protein
LSERARNAHDNSNRQDCTQVTVPVHSRNAHALTIRTCADPQEVR